MKKILIAVCLLIILGAVGFYIYDFHLTPNNLARTIIKDVENGLFRVDEIGVLSDERITTYMVYEMLRIAGEKRNPFLAEKYYHKVFEAPRQVVKTKLVKKSTSTIDYWKIKNMSQYAFENFGYKYLYKTYEDFLTSETNLLKDKSGYNYNEKLLQIEFIFGEIGWKKYQYKIQTSSGMQYFTMIFFKIPEKGWKLAITQCNETGFS